MTTAAARASADERRRLEILRRTLMGIDEDLEDMRDELSGGLSDYEGRLRRRTDALPIWLALAGAELRALFRLPDDGPIEGGLLGPRTVALAATEVEAFIDRWFGRDAPGDRLPDFTRQAARAEYAEACERLESFLDAVDASAAQAADGARARLEELLDAILEEIESQRESDVDALEALVSEGEIETGHTTQEEIANLWEEQRARVADITAAWRPIEALVDEGLERTVRGTRELRELFLRAQHGLFGAFPELVADGADALLPGFDDEAPLDDEHPDAAPVDEESVDEAPVDEAPAAGFEIDVAGDTVPEPDLAAMLAAQAAAPAGEDDAIEVDDVAADDDATDDDTSEASDAADDEVEASDVVDEEPEDDDEETEANEEPEGDEGQDDDEVPEAPEEGDDGEPEGEEEAPKAPARPAHRTECFRVLTGWKPVGRLELVAVLAPPLLHYAAMVGLAVAFLVGAIDTNPVHEYDWLIGSLIVATAWLVLVPILLQWHPTWRGLRPGFVRHSEVHQQAQILVDERRLSIDRTSWPIRDIQTVECLRWESPDDGTCGWLLVIEPRYHRDVIIATGESDLTMWKADAAECREIPPDVWQMGPDEFEALRERLMDS